MPTSSAARLLSALLLAVPAAAQVPATPAPTTPGTLAVAPAAPVLRAGRRTGPITLDGRLDEPDWQHAPASSDFTQSYPTPGGRPSYRTEVRVLYDYAALYVGVRMFDAHPDSIASQLARRDATAANGVYSDWLHVTIDSYHDRRTGFRFSVNPAGVKKDVYTYNDRYEDVNWDAVWEVATRIDSLGWVAEYRIPVSQLRFGGKAPPGGRVWGFQVMRDVARTNERDSWSPWTQQDPGLVSRFGDLAGLVDLPAPSRLELLPYASERLTRAPGTPGDPFFRANASRPSVGADLQYGLPAGLTLSATANPDFGQVEVDPAVVNLSAFETFFPEKRPFFLEQADSFGFGQIVTHNEYSSETYFYSRRVGRQPQLGVGRGAAYADAPDQTTILGAAKVTGKAGPWTVGMLDAVTNEERARVQDGAGLARTVPVEPLTNYFVGRAKRELRGGQSFLGGMLTATDRQADDPVVSPFLRRDALFGGMDFEHDLQQRAWILTGYLAGSRVGGSPDALALTQRSSTHYYQRPDASYLHLDPLRTSLAGHTAEIAVERSGAWIGSLNYKEVSPGFEINDLGYEGRADYRALSTLVGYQDFRAGARLRQWVLFGYTNHAYNFGGQSIFQAAGFGANGTFTNLWTASLRLTGSPRYGDDRLTRGGPVALAPAQGMASLTVGSDTRRTVSGTATASHTRDDADGDLTQASVSVDVRPAAWLHVNTGPRLSILDNRGQYVQTVVDPAATLTYGQRDVFADLHQATLSLDTRLDWTFTTALSLQLYAQPFVSAGNYVRFKELARPGTFAFRVYGKDTGTITPTGGGYAVVPAAGAAPFTIGYPDFDFRSLRGNAVLRWEYRPGSALFLVWTQTRSGIESIGDFDARRDVDAIFRERPTNVFLVKATYWLGR